MRCLSLAIVTLLVGLAGAQERPAFSWQQPHAEVLPTGDLRWQPQPYQYRPGRSVRYVDFAGGRDTNDGLTPATAWQHHPWDPAATGAAAACQGVHTYVFKRGVVYRGALVADESGTAEEPIQLTSDPAWGTGEAVICGSERVTGWQRGAANATIPEPEKVWHADLDWLPRNAWVVAADGQVKRLALARTPNWTVSDPDDIKSEWWEWDLPGQPFDVFTTGAQGQRLHLGIDTKHLTQPAEYYQDAIVWTEYGWVMGTPYPARVEAVDTARKGLGFGGQWGGVGGQKIVRHNRYYLEDKPHYLDAPGEFWFERQGAGGRLYLRLPGDQDPTQAHLEVARRLNLIDAKQVSHLRVSGLTFRFTNVLWDLTAGPWAGDDTEPACLRLLGGGEDLQVTHCRFEHVTRPVRLKALNGQAIDRVLLADNEVHDADHAAFDLADDGDWGVALPTARLLDVRILRNKLDRIGLRPSRYGQGHAIEVRCAETLEVAGNILDRLYGSGIFVFGGKQNDALVDRPLSRLLIHHNKVTDSLLNTNDWGGIETWQGGPAYVYNNLSGNPGGYWNYSFKLNPGKPNVARFGHAYYLDGAFQNYHFNNIAWGKSSDPLSRLGNTSAFQEIHSYQNTFFNNTIDNFVIGSRRQSPQAGRNKYLGNVWQRLGQYVFRHSDPAKAAPEGNAADAGPQGSNWAYATNAYRWNVFAQVAAYGCFHETGAVWPTFAEFQASLTACRALAADLGTEVAALPLPQAAEHDFRPPAGSPVVDSGVRVFVPWGLSAVVGEWHFAAPGDDPTRILDEHWYLTSYHVGRDSYHQRPMYPLQAVGVTGEHYVAGQLEDWTNGALHLNGQNQYARVANADLDRPFEYPVKYTVPAWAKVTVPGAATVGQPCAIQVRLTAPPVGQKLRADLHFSKADGSFGGFNAYGGEAQAITGPGPYTFRMTPQARPDLGGLTLILWTTPTGEWADQTQVARVPLALVGTPAAKATPQTVDAGGGPVDQRRTAQGADLRSPEVYTSNFLVEVYFRAAAGRPGVLVQKLAGSGYSLRLDATGRPVFTVAGAARSEVTGPSSLADGQWHHVIAEADRPAAQLRLYVDGALAAKADGPGPQVSLANDADLLVGGTPTGDGLAGDLDFVRIALGTLADAKTTIEELYAWQFDGPQLRDFTGRKPAGARRDAGALERVE